jgi:hypothetical protein
MRISQTLIVFFSPGNMNIFNNNAIFSHTTSKSNKTGFRPVSRQQQTTNKNNCSLKIHGLRIVRSLLYKTKGVKVNPEISFESHSNNKLQSFYKTED